MPYPKACKPKHGGNAQISPGTYQGEIVDMCNAPGYKPGAAFRLTYHITLKNGAMKIFEETFVNNENNPRSAAFFEKIESYGIDSYDLENLIGLREMLTFEKVVSVSGIPFTNIVSREIIKEGEEENDIL